jgi:dienelactone hydrolase
MRGRTVTLLAIAAALIGAGFIVPDYQRGAALVIDAAGIGGWTASIARIDTHAFRTASVTVASRHGALRARTYRPDDGSGRAVVLLPGVHAGGIDEPRLIRFAEDLAERGVTVAAVELPDLKQYAITARTTDMIEDAARWLSAERELAPEGRAGIIGISFAGGLGVVAAGRETLRGKVSYALSLGGHGDLPRTLAYLCTGRQPDGTYRAPHDYGVVIILLGVADRVVPAAQVEPLRRGIRLFLEASHADMVDKVRAVRLFRKALDYAEQLPEPAATYMRYVNVRDVKVLGPRLIPHVGALSSDPGLSPDRSPAPRVPVYLLHGSDDNVIPAIESTLLARHLEGSTDVHVLLSSLITHAEVDRPVDFGEVWKLIAFWSSALDE